MATNNNLEKLAKLTTYAEVLKQRLAGAVPPKHVGHPEAFKQMLQIDLDKTLKAINKLKS